MATLKEQVPPHADLVAVFLVQRHCSPSRARPCSCRVHGREYLSQFTSGTNRCWPISHLMNRGQEMLAYQPPDEQGRGDHQ